ncbi:hypothetical protein Pmani_021891 [Petrolisthes manimaculis]|uniref:[histone H4]-lysine(20) N-methyltransferase n=1 Tax=Petrolisthes manimaculis TaxID=1843537 RepID=A0AAE1PFA2_9EUCA|nr:hypothetical protein Pmani_021891 [Petrolisthes manimaculis]
MVSHIHTIPKSVRLRSAQRGGKMVKGKRRTNRCSKDENTVVSHRDGPKRPKDSRLETKVINGSFTKSKAGCTTQSSKISNYFSPSRSPPVADDAEVEGATFIDVGCRVESELNHAQLSRPLPISAPTTPTKHMNGHVEGSPTKLGLGTPPKRTVCTRSQALKELQLQSSPTAIISLKGPSSPTSNGLAIPCALHSPIPSPTLESPVTVSAPSTPTSSTCSAVEDCCNSHTGPPTPHKIQALNEERLRLDSPLSPSSALSKLKLSLAPKKLAIDSKTTKARRKLTPQSGTRGGVTTQGKAEKTSKAGAVTVTNGEVKPALRSGQITKFFPIRRSERKPKTTLIQERQKEIEERIKTGKEEGLTVKHFGAKGRGVVTTRKFAKGEFVVEYIGDLIDMKEAKDREKRYALDASKGCYNYYFTHQNQQYCIDATEESGYVGRLVNHSRNGNLVTKAVEVEGEPHLILLAKRDLETGTEILYDYGDRSKEALEHHPWLAS